MSLPVGDVPERSYKTVKEIGSVQGGPMPEYNITVTQKNTSIQYEFVQSFTGIMRAVESVSVKRRDEEGVWVIIEEAGEAYFIPNDTIDLIEIEEIPPEEGGE